MEVLSITDASPSHFRVCTKSLNWHKGLDTYPISYPAHREVMMNHGRVEQGFVFDLDSLKARSETLMSVNGRE
jgi:hypothetical protein